MVLGRAYIQYWLIQFNTYLPGGRGWNQFQFTGSRTYIATRTAAAAASVPVQPITNLEQLSLTGTVSAGGDSVILFDGYHCSTR